uniref:Uncharacterized protein n=1 Tax=Glossina austeni TaxID=7395 RepID=A0A1A9V0G7_GLOAU
MKTQKRIYVASGKNDYDYIQGLWDKELLYCIIRLSPNPDAMHPFHRAFDEKKIFSEISIVSELPAAVQHNSASDTYKGKKEWKHIWEICLIYTLFFPRIISSP